MGNHLEEKRRRIEQRGEIRELVFGVQDGLISSVGLVGGMQGATADSRMVLLAGLSAVVAGAVSMGAGSYLSSKAAKEVIEKEIADEAVSVDKEPHLAQEDLLGALCQEGLNRHEAYRIIQILYRRNDLFFKTYQEKVLGIGSVDLGRPFRAALVMAFSFAIGAFIPLISYLFIHGSGAFYTSGVLSASTLFGVGALKGKFACRSLIFSGMEFFGVALGAAGLGYLIGLLLNSF
ncbi:MAG: VIT1/CCC1 transporter family protein [Nitrospiria bacterium]